MAIGHGQMISILEKLAPDCRCLGPHIGRLSGSSAAVIVLEDGAVASDLAHSKRSPQENRTNACCTCDQLSATWRAGFSISK
jgi:hypothetical protein